MIKWNLKLFNVFQTITFTLRKIARRPLRLPNYIRACPSCFTDHGLKLLASKVAIAMPGKCPNCGHTSSEKLRLSDLQYIAHTFFVWGTLNRSTYGAAPILQMNDSQKTSVIFTSGLREDAKIFEKLLGLGFFHYGPRLWMIGYITPLESLITPAQRAPILQRIIKEYPVIELAQNDVLYRIRKQPKDPADENEYDTPPAGIKTSGRLETPGLPIMYASTNLDICVHECRYTAEDEIYVASLTPVRPLRLLDLTHILKEDVTEFESLDLAIHMLFLASSHSYDTCRSIAEAAKAAGFDGLLFPSYFSLLHTGAMPFMTTYGISHRIIPSLHQSEHAKIVANIALFGHPIAKGDLKVVSLNRLIMASVEYDFHFGPVSYS